MIIQDISISPKNVKQSIFIQIHKVSSQMAAGLFCFTHQDLRLSPGAPLTTNTYTTHPNPIEDTIAQALHYQDMPGRKRNGLSSNTRYHKS